MHSVIMQTSELYRTFCHAGFEGQMKTRGGEVAYDLVLNAAFEF